MKHTKTEWVYNSNYCTSICFRDSLLKSSVSDLLCYITKLYARHIGYPETGWNIWKPALLFMLDLWLWWSGFVIIWACNCGKVLIFIAFYSFFILFSFFFLIGLIKIRHIFRLYLNYSIFILYHIYIFL